MPSFLTLPRELIERIFLYLNFPSILSCRLVNKELSNIIGSSTVLQYFQACEAAGVIDNPFCKGHNLSYAERLELLKQREEAWMKLVPTFTKEIRVIHQPSTIYDLTAGVYLLGDMNLRDLHYCTLPSVPEDDPKWVRIPGHGPKEKWNGCIVDMGMAIYEHDLIVNVVTLDTGPQEGANRYSLDMVLLQFSTGEYHPLARQSRIHVQKSPSLRPAVALEIVGDNLALVVNSRHGPFPDKLFIYDWKSGFLRLQHESTENAYSSLVFVSAELLLIPNVPSSEFEVWRIPPSISVLGNPPAPPYQVLSLQIPIISRGYFLLTLSCRGEPNPFLSLSSPYSRRPSRPFYPSPEDSVIITNLRLASFPGLESAAFTLIMHRRALLETIMQWTTGIGTLGPASPNASRLPQWLKTSYFHINDMEVSENIALTPSECTSNFTGLNGQNGNGHRPKYTYYTGYSRVISVPQGSRPDSPTLAVQGGTGSGQKRFWIPQVPWSNWGPPISKWFRTDSETQPRWITTSAGQRCAFLYPPDENGKTAICVADFNQCNYKKNMMTIKKRVRESNLFFLFGKEVEWEYLEHDGVFAEDLKMGLKCVVYSPEAEHEFDGLLMDEERLLGLKVGGEGKVESVTVLYFG